MGKGRQEFQSSLMAGWDNYGARQDPWFTKTCLMSTMR